MQTLLKQPAEELKRELPVPGAGAILEILTVTAESRGLVAGSAPIEASGSLTAGMLFVDLAGGTDGERYLVTAQVRDAAGELREAELELAVIESAWIMPGGGAGWLSVAEFVARFGLEETVRMTDGDGSGRIDRALLVNALTDAQAIAEANIAARYALPLTDPPPLVKTAIADMARARLYPRGMPEGVADAAKVAERRLEQIGSGKLKLPAAAPIAEAPSASPILISPGRRQYPGGLEDY